VLLYYTVSYVQPHDERQLKLGVMLRKLRVQAETNYNLLIDVVVCVAHKQESHLNLLEYVVVDQESQHRKHKSVLVLLPTIIGLYIQGWR